MTAGCDRVLPVLAATLAIAGPALPASAAPPERPMATLWVEIGGDEGRLTVAQSLVLLGGGPGSWTVPLLLPETGPQPPRQQRVGEAPGLEVRPRGGASVEVRDGNVVVSGTPGTSGEFGAEVFYPVRVEDSRTVLAAVPGLTLAQVQVIHRGGPHALHVRPMEAFGYREESEGDGTWRYQDLSVPVPAGRPLRIAVGRLPVDSGPYQAAGLGVLAVVAALSVLGMARRRAR